jgi:RNA polymerase sigma-70 factor (ECF subfamily)
LIFIQWFPFTSNLESLFGFQWVSASGLQFLTRAAKILCGCHRRSQLPRRFSIDCGAMIRHDPDALAEAVRDHARPLLRAAMSMGFPGPEAEDLVQDVFTTFLERLDRFEGRSQLRTWLFGILHHKVMERRRASRNDDRTDPIDETFESRFDKSGKWVRPPEDIERLMLSKEIGGLIQGCMDELPANQRGAFVLREVEGIETAEICKILSVTVTNFGVLMHRARVRLRECLEAKGWSQR